MGSPLKVAIRTAPTVCSLGTASAVAKTSFNNGALYKTSSLSCVNKIHGIRVPPRFSVNVNT